jgi:hypothetical protein
MLTQVIELLEPQAISITQRIKCETDAYSI